MNINLYKPLAILSVVIGICIGPSQVKAKSSKTTNNLRCEEPVARMLSATDLRFMTGELLCQGSQFVILVPSKKVDVLCFSTGQLMTFANREKVDRCLPPRERGIPCHRFWTSACRIPRAQDLKQNTPFIIRPFGRSVMKGIPTITWQPVISATDYAVKIDGIKLNWQQKVAKTRLVYPEGQPKLPSGAFRIIVIAFKGDDPLSADEVAINVDPISIDAVKKSVKRVQGLGLPEDELAYQDLDKIYFSRGMVDCSIDQLEARTRSGSTNPRIFRVLGDRYIDVGFPELAKPKYEQALMFAKQSGNTAESKKAKFSLDAIAAYERNEI